MAGKRKNDKLDENLKDTAKKIGKAIARTQAKLTTTRRQARKRAEAVVEKISQTAEEAIGRAAKKIQNSEDKIQGTRKGSSSRFKAHGRKSVADSIGVLAEEIRAYLEENEAIGLSKLVNVMKSRGNSEAMSFGAIGWLARDGKIAISRDGKKISIR